MAGSAIGDLTPTQVIDVDRADSLFCVMPQGLLVVNGATNTCCLIDSAGHTVTRVRDAFGYCRLLSAASAGESSTALVLNHRAVFEIEIHDGEIETIENVENYGFDVQHLAVCGANDWWLLCGHRVYLGNKFMKLDLLCEQPGVVFTAVQFLCNAAALGWKVPGESRVGVTLFNYGHRPAAGATLEFGGSDIEINHVGDVLFIRIDRSDELLQFRVKGLHDAEGMSPARLALRPRTIVSNGNKLALVEEFSGRARVHVFA